jgi:hypothetical protein
MRGEVPACVRSLDESPEGGSVLGAINGTNVDAQKPASIPDKAGKTERRLTVECYHGSARQSWENQVSHDQMIKIRSLHCIFSLHMPFSVKQP